MLTYKTAPLRGVSQAHPDGLYINRQPTGIQVISVGPLPCSPREILDDFPGLTIKSVTVLGPPDDAPDQVKQMVLGRLFLAIELAPDLPPVKDPPQDGEVS